MYSRGELVVKRALDLVGATVGLAVTAPLIVGAAALVKLSSPGPAIFRHARVGRGGQPFELLKLRTMRVGEPGPQITAGGDPRVTPVGRMLRRAKIDELPQLLNVIRGDLSLVGPRPEVARYVALYPPADREILLQFRPGITDPATVRFRDEEEELARSPDPEAAYVREVLPTKVRMYREYLEGASIGSDVRVLVDTLRAILRVHPGR